MNLVGLTVDSVSASSINAQNSNIAQTVLGAVNLGSDLAYSMDVNVKVLTSDLLSATSYAGSGKININSINFMGDFENATRIKLANNVLANAVIASVSTADYITADNGLRYNILKVSLTVQPTNRASG